MLHRSYSYLSITESVAVWSFIVTIQQSDIASLRIDEMVVKVRSQVLLREEAIQEDDGVINLGFSNHCVPLDKEGGLGGQFGCLLRPFSSHLSHSFIIPYFQPERLSK